MRQVVAAELDAHRKRLLETAMQTGNRAQVDSDLVFPAPRGGHIDLEKFRHREWAPALRAAVVEHRRVYDTRHTFATWAIEGGMNPMLLAPLMGTSIRELEDTYFRWLGRTDEQVRALLDNYDAQAVAQ